MENINQYAMLQHQLSLLNQQRQALYLLNNHQEALLNTHLKRNMAFNFVPANVHLLNLKINPFVPSVGLTTPMLPNLMSLTSIQPLGEMNSNFVSLKEKLFIEEFPAQPKDSEMPCLKEAPITVTNCLLFLFNQI